MTLSDPRLASELAERDRQLSALRATFLIAAHHGVALRPEDLPRLVEGDITPSVLKAMQGAGFTARLIEGAKWKTLAGLGKAVPAMAGRPDGSWVIVVALMPDHSVAFLDPSDEAKGVQTLSQAAFLWSACNWAVRERWCLQATA